MKYKFIAEFAGGSFIEQTDDISSIDPKRSQFYDVLQREGLIKFTLVHTETGVEYGLDLETLNFNVNGNEFRLHTERDLPLSDIELVYYRNMKVELSIGDLSPFKNIETGEAYYVHTSTDGQPHMVSVRLGWKAKQGQTEILKFIEID